MLWISLWDVSASAHITLYAVDFTMRRISASAHITLYAVDLTMRRISASAHITLCAVIFTMRRNGISLYHTPCCGFHYETYIGITQNRTLAVVWNAIYGHYVLTWSVTWSCEKILLAQFSLYVHKGGLKPDSFNLFMYGHYVMCDLIVWENTNFANCSRDMDKYSTRPMNKLFAHTLFKDECCIFPYHTQMNIIQDIYIWYNRSFALTLKCFLFLWYCVLFQYIVNKEFDDTKW